MAPVTEKQYPAARFKKQLAGENACPRLPHRTKDQPLELSLRRRSWLRGPLLGSGTFGNVYLGMCLRTCKVIAVKSCPAERGSSQLKALENELSIFSCTKGLQHTVAMLGSDTTVEGGVLTRNLLLEYADGGNLASLSARFNGGGGLPEELVGRLTRGMVEGLLELHRKGIVHSDVKGQNVLLKDGTVKLCDFGSSHIVGEQPKCETKGTLCWMAPEVLSCSENGPESDIWSLGCTVLEILTGQVPWADKCGTMDWTSVVARLGCARDLPTLPSEISEECRDFLLCCLVRDPRGRWTAGQLLQHPFVAKHMKVRPKLDDDADSCGCCTGAMMMQGKLFCEASLSPVSVIAPDFDALMEVASPFSASGEEGAATLLKRKTPLPSFQVSSPDVLQEATTVKIMEHGRPCKCAVRRDMGVSSPSIVHDPAQGAPAWEATGRPAQPSRQGSMQLMLHQQQQQQEGGIEKSLHQAEWQQSGLAQEAAHAEEVHASITSQFKMFAQSSLFSAPHSPLLTMPLQEVAAVLSPTPPVRPEAGACSDQPPLSMERFSFPAEHASNVQDSESGMSAGSSNEDIPIAMPTDLGIWVPEHPACSATSAFCSN